MEKEEIIKRLKKGDKFKLNLNKNPLLFTPLLVNENTNEIKVRCCNRINNYNWIEDWDDLDITINAFIIKEYIFE